MAELEIQENDKLEPEEEALLKVFKQNENSALKTFVGLYKGHYLNLFFSIIFFLLKSSPVWVLPIVTGNIINAATTKDNDAIHTIVVNIIIILIMVFQNILTNYIHTVLYAKNNKKCREGS